MARKLQTIHNNNLTVIPLPIRIDRPKTATLDRNLASGSRNRLNMLYFEHLSSSEALLLQIGRNAVTSVIAAFSLSWAVLSLLVIVTPHRLDNSSLKVV